MSWTHVQEAHNGSLASGASQGTIAATFGAAVGAGHIVVGWVFMGQGQTLSSVSDGSGNTYVAPQTKTFSIISRAYWFYGVNITGGPTVITANFTGNVVLHAIQVREFSCTAGASSFDVSNSQSQAAPGTLANAISSGSFTTTKVNDLVYGSVIDMSAGTHQTQNSGTGYVSGTTIGASEGTLDEYDLTAALGSVAVTFRDATNGGADTYATGGMAFFENPSPIFSAVRPRFGF